jgi:hypothetical protein
VVMRDEFCDGPLQGAIAKQNGFGEAFLLHGSHPALPKENLQIGPSTHSIAGVGRRSFSSGQRQTSSFLSL